MTMQAFPNGSQLRTGSASHFLESCPVRSKRKMALHKTFRSCHLRRHKSLSLSWNLNCYKSFSCIPEHFLPGLNPWDESRAPPAESFEYNGKRMLSVSWRTSEFQDDSPGDCWCVLVWGWAPSATLQNSMNDSSFYGLHKGNATSKSKKGEKHHQEAKDILEQKWDNIVNASACPA